VVGTIRNHSTSTFNVTGSYSAGVRRGAAAATAAALGAWFLAERRCWCGGTLWEDATRAANAMRLLFSSLEVFSIPGCYDRMIDSTMSSCVSHQYKHCPESGYRSTRSITFFAARSRSASSAPHHASAPRSVSARGASSRAEYCVSVAQSLLRSIGFRAPECASP